jgi:hypothetical protein
MSKNVRLGALALAFVLGAAGAARAEPQPVSWVSRFGSDPTGAVVRDCSEAQPCRTFAAALVQTRDGGSIMCLDSGAFGPLDFLLKSITIDCSGHVAFLERVTIGDFDKPRPIIVILRGLTIYGNFNFSRGVGILGGSIVHIENCRITGFANAPGSDSAGIMFDPEGEARLHVTDSVISGNGNPPDAARRGAGIIVRAPKTGEVRIMLTRVQVHTNAFGILVDGPARPGSIALTLTDSVVGGNLDDGVFAVTRPGQGTVRLTLERTRLLNNFKAGIRAGGQGTTLRVTDSTVTGNATGLAFATGAALLSAGNNLVEGNGVNGVFSGRVALK